jgi:hypothetical protein
MSAGLKQIDLDIAEVEQCIVDKNETIIAGLTKGRDTILEEGEVGVMNTALQGMRGARRKLAGKIRAPRRPSEKRARKARI